MINLDPSVLLWKYIPPDGLQIGVNDYSHPKAEVLVVLVKDDDTQEKWLDGYIDLDTKDGRLALNILAQIANICAANCYVNDRPHGFHINTATVGWTFVKADEE